MSRTLLVVLAGVASWLLPTTAAAQGAAAAARRQFLDRHCVACHNARLLTAGLALDTVETGMAPANAAVWEKVIRKVRSGAMPPAPRPRPDASAAQAFVVGLEAEIDAAAERNPAPGRPAPHRLNRAEYANAIRDLLALDIEVESLLPPDDAGYGFDNIGDVLSLSPMLMERYLSASATVSRLAVGVSDAGPASKTYTLSKYLRQDGRMSDALPFGSRGGLAVRHTFPLSGEYTLRVRLLKNHRDQLRGMTQRHQLEVRVDGARVKLFEIGRERGASRTPADAEAMQQYVLHGDENLDLVLPISAGPHDLSVTFIERPSVPEGALGQQMSVASFGFSGAAVDDDQQPAVWTLRVDGPFKPTPGGPTPSRARLFVCRPPADAAGGSPADIACARRILSALARRAYRRPVTDADVDVLLDFFQQARPRGFDAGVELALRRILVSPEFLFRVERDPSAVGPSRVYTISDLELATRLSFFLWSSIPDDELLEVAEGGRLRQPPVLAAQVQRMLRDGRANALVENFARQWLYIRNMRLVAPDPNVFPEFDDNLREAFERETQLFLLDQLRGDRGVPDLLTADYTFVNDRLARHYGMPGVYGSHFRRVSLEGSSRRGLLGHASVLTVTSYATRTSPVLRGKWLLENVLGAPPPAPPPNVPALKENTGRNGAPLSVRERMEQHRKNPVCASCHAQMDPLGFALENFDGVGKWRAAAENGAAIDASATLPNGTVVNGPSGLREALLGTADAFVGTVAEKLLTYALGRGLDHQDAPAIRKIVRASAADGYRWSSIIRGIIESAPFRQRAAEPGASEVAGLTRSTNR